MQGGNGRARGPGRETRATRAPEAVVAASAHHPSLTVLRDTPTFDCMSTFFSLAALVLLLSIVAGLVRVARGPSAADRMLSAQLFGTTGVAVLLLLAEAGERPPLRDAALIFAILAAMIIAVFVKHAVLHPGSRDDG
jgi:multicomponent Na+:H+ antiporter subunit F